MQFEQTRSDISQNLSIVMVMTVLIANKINDENSKLNEVSKVKK